MALRRYVEARFKTKTRAVPNPLTGVVNTGVTKVAKNNPDRLFLLVINLSDVNMQLGFFPDTSATKGMLLAAAGGTVTLSADEDAELVGYEFNVYSPGDAKAIFVLEIEGE